MNKDSKVTKVEVVDDDDNVLISMNYNKIEYDKKFADDYFKLNSIIKNNDEEKNTNKEQSTNQNNTTNENNSTTNTDTNTNSTTDNNAIKDKEDTTNETNTESSSTTSNDDTKTDLNNETSSNTTNNSTNTNNNSNEAQTNTNDTSNNADNLETKETLSIDDIIYPMYLPDNTYLTSQDRIDTENGERLILTFGGDNSFVLVEETISSNDSNLVIPVSGEFDFLSDVIGVISTNSVMWHSNGIEYYITSDTLETSVLVDIARSISVLPVSK